MERMLERKPLYQAERRARPATVCVTGGSSYLGSSTVARLLAAGHTVHATCRQSTSTAAVVAALNELPGAKERLRWFAADLMEEGSFDQAIAGCKYVIHTASPCLNRVPSKHAFEQVIGPAIHGVRNVLRSVNRAQSVEKVVMTSSIAALLSKAQPGHTFSEDDWNLACLQEKDYYATSKTLAEWEAWAIAGQQTRWKLVTLLPGITFGPTVVPNYRSESVQVVQELMDGSYWPFVPPLWLFTVDVDDVAAAHVLAMSLPKARGRYILVGDIAATPDIAAKLKEWYPRHWVPYIKLSTRVAAVMFRMMGLNTAAHHIEAEYHKHPWDLSKATTELGMSFIPLDKTLQDTVEGLMGCGALQRKDPPNPQAVQAVQSTAIKVVQDTVAKVVMSLKGGSRIKSLSIAGGACVLLLSIFYR